MPSMIAGEGPDDVCPLPRRRWLNGTVRFAEGVGENPVYACAWDRMVKAVAADPDWSAWWQRAGTVVLELNPVLASGGRGRPRVRRGLTEVRVECTLDGARLDPAGSGDLARLAAADLFGLLDLVRRQLGLSALPSLPEPAQWPEAADPSAGERRGYDVLPQDEGEIIRTLVEVMGLPLEQAKAIVAAPRRTRS